MVRESEERDIVRVRKERTASRRVAKTVKEGQSPKLYGRIWRLCGGRDGLLLARRHVLAEARAPRRGGLHSGQRHPLSARRLGGMLALERRDLGERSAGEADATHRGRARRLRIPGRDVEGRHRRRTVDGWRRGPRRGRVDGY
jgi:hypothetical protein